MQTTKATIWGAGVPTEPDVKAIVAKFAPFAVGDLLTHDALETVTNTKRGTHRYRTIITALKRHTERECGLVLGAVAGTGYKVLDDCERVDMGLGKLHSAGRASMRAVTVVSGTDKASMPAEYRIRADHVTACAATVVGAMRTQSKALRDELQGVKRIAE